MKFIKLEKEVTFGSTYVTMKLGHPTTGYHLLHEIHTEFDITRDQRRSQIGACLGTWPGNLVLGPGNPGYATVRYNCYENLERV